MEAVLAPGDAIRNQRSEVGEPQPTSPLSPKGAGQQEEVHVRQFKPRSERSEKFSYSEVTARQGNLWGISPMSSLR